MNAETSSTYRVTVSREGDQWVARDEQGHKRAWGHVRFAPTACEAVTAIFHACEVVGVDDHGEIATAVIRTA